MPPKRKQPEEGAEEGEEQNEGLRGNAPAAAGAGGGVVLFGGVSCSAAALRAVRKPFKVVGGCVDARFSVHQCPAVPHMLLPACPL